VTTISPGKAFIARPPLCPVGAIGAGLGAATLGDDDTRRHVFRDPGGGVVRSYRDLRDSAIEAGRFVQQRQPGATIAIVDVRDGWTAPFERPTNRTA